MEIKILQEKLAKALGSVSKVAAGARASLPILSNVMIRVDEGKVQLTTTNLDMAVVANLTVADAKNGVVTVPARLIAEFVSNLPRGEMVELRAENDNKLVISAGGYSSSVNGTAADEFPELPIIDEGVAAKIAVPMEDFKAGLGQIMIAVGSDTTRPTLMGAYFNTHEGELYLAATDGYRLGERRLAQKVEGEVAAIVPANSLRSVMGLLSEEADEVEMWFDEAQVKFRIGEIELISKLIDGSFPDYRMLIPKTSEVAVELPKDELTRTTKLAALFAHEVGGSVVCATRQEDGVFTIASVANELGENSSEIKTDVNMDGKVTLNSRFLLDALNVTNGEKIEFKFSNKLDPVVIKSKEDTLYTHIIMPLKS